MAPAGMLPACGLLEQRAGAARCCDGLHGGLGGGLAGVFQVEDVDRRAPGAGFGLPGEVVDDAGDSLSQPALPSRGGGGSRAGGAAARGA